MKITLDDLQRLRNEKGVYFLYNNKKLVYIGYSDNIYLRILEHKLEAKKEFEELLWTKYEDREVAILSEAYLIHKLKPKYNKLIVENFNKWFLTISLLLSKKIELSFIEKQNNDYNDLLDINVAMGAKDDTLI